MGKELLISPTGAYDLFDGEIKVCLIDVEKIDHFQSSKYANIPCEWEGKPVLEIEGFGVIGEHGKGYGRIGLQECYKLAQKISEGRIIVDATWGAGPFYEHCGFKGVKEGEPGIKYFEPTPEAIKALFPEKQNSKNQCLLKERESDLDFQMDFQLDDIPAPTDDIGNQNQEKTGGIKDLLALKAQKLDKASEHERQERENAVKQAEKIGEPLSRENVKKLRDKEEKARLEMYKQLLKQRGP